jgi:hypothetical protein
VFLAKISVGGLGQPFGVSNATGVGLCIKPAPEISMSEIKKMPAKKVFFFKTNNSIVAKC